MVLGLLGLLGFVRIEFHQANLSLAAFDDCSGEGRTVGFGVLHTT